MIALNILSWLAITAYSVYLPFVGRKPAAYRMLMIVLGWTLVCWLLGWPSLLFLGHAVGYGVAKVSK